MGTGAGLFEVKLIGDEYFTFVTECKDPKACTILLRGASKEILAVRTTLGSAAHFILLHISFSYTHRSAAPSALLHWNLDLHLVSALWCLQLFFHPLSAAVPSLT